jgi:hypothetical protein
VTDPAAVRKLTTRLRFQADLCSAGPSPFYGALLQHLATDAEANGPTWDRLGDTVDEPPRNLAHLGLLAGVHHLVLTGQAPALAAHYPSTGGDGDADAAWPALRDVLATRGDELEPWLRRRPQTNEVGRAAALMSGLLEVAAETRRPIRLLEIGASAGLNLCLDHFWYQAGERGAGDPSSPVRFVDLWEGGTPPFEAPLRVTERAGCDRAPIDVGTEAGRLTLLAYIWADQTERFTMLRAAFEVADRVPVRVEQAEALDWLPARLADSRPGTTTVVFHSIVLLYFSDEDAARLRAVLEAAGRTATADAPLAWLRLEPSRLTDADVELRLTTWPVGRDRHLARTTPHLGPVRYGGADPGQAPSDSSSAPTAAIARDDASA